MLTLPSGLNLKKNELAQSGAWIILVKVQITGIKTLVYKNQTADFKQGDLITGTTSGATGEVFSITDVGTVGTLYLYDIKGTFVADEYITGVLGGSAKVNTSGGAHNVGYAWARNNEDISWNGSIYLANAIQIDVAQQNIEGKSTDLTVSIANMDRTFEGYVNKCFGLHEETLTTTLVHSESVGLASTDCVFEEAWTISEASVSYEWITFVVGGEPKMFQTFPRYRYEWGPCRYQYKSATTCQDAGTFCHRVLDHPSGAYDCVTNSNELHFGAFPAIPGGKF